MLGLKCGSIDAAIKDGYMFKEPECLESSAETRTEDWSNDVDGLYVAIELRTLPRATDCSTYIYDIDSQLLILIDTW